MQERQYLAHELAKDKVSLERAHQRKGHAEDAEEQVGDGQIQQEHIRYRAHPLVLHQRQDDERVPDHRQQEDYRVKRDLHFAHGQPTGGAAAG